MREENQSLQGWEELRILLSVLVFVFCPKEEATAGGNSRVA